MTCTYDSHDALRTNALLFIAGTTRLRREGDLLVGECSNPECRSTLALVVCKYCDTACASTDCIPIPHTDDEHGHAACVIAEALRTRQTRFVLVKGGGKAIEFRTVKKETRT